MKKITSGPDYDNADIERRSSSTLRSFSWSSGHTEDFPAVVLPETPVRFKLFDEQNDKFAIYDVIGEKFEIKDRDSLQVLLNKGEKIFGVTRESLTSFSYSTEFFVPMSDEPTLRAGPLQYRILYELIFGREGYSKEVFSMPSQTTIEEKNDMAAQLR